MFRINREATFQQGKWLRFESLYGAWYGLDTLLFDGNSIRCSMLIIIPGKTLQVIALTYTLLRHSDITKVSKVLIICPFNVILNWIDEFNIWLESFRKDECINVFQLVSS